MKHTPPPNKLYLLFGDKNLTRLSVGIIIIGIILRLVFYFQNRCLFIDEANIARNIYERSFIGLTKPLNYEQYAPPLFLWIIKSFTLVFGYSELPFRLFPLLCGIASLWLMYMALKKYAGKSGIWYALMIMASGAIYISYSAEIKQYICDVVVVLSLLLLALRTDIFTMPRMRFFTLWLVVGSVTIWLSMPSVFMLTGIGVYYLYLCIKAKRYNNILVLSAVGIIWLAQFAAYYFIILKPQIQSEYLQNCHKEFFLYPFPTSSLMLDHDINVFNKLISAIGGKWALSVAFHLLSLVVGAIWLFRKETAKALLLVIPICVLIAAAMVHEYALTPRLILFIMPLFLIIIATGLHILFRIKFVAVKAIWVIIAIICITNFGAFNLLYKRMDFEEITKNMAFVQQQKITGEHLYVHNSGVPAFIYYTTIHPEKDKWKDIENAHRLTWNINYDSLGRSFTGKSALLYSWAPDEEMADKAAALKRYHKQVLLHHVTGSSVFIFE